MVLDEEYMRQALRLAERALGCTSPNPMVGAILVKGREIIGRGWHRRAGRPHAEIEALQDATRRSHDPRGATLYVTLEPCCTFGRTPPCTEAILAAGIKRVVVAAIDPNPAHSGKGLRILREAGVKVDAGLLESEAARLNETFNHWIMKRTPFVIVKAAMSLDGKIGTAMGESKWITGEKARAIGMKLRKRVDAILVGVNTVIADDPSLTVRTGRHIVPRRRIILDSEGRTPRKAKILSDEFAPYTTVVTTRKGEARLRSFNSKAEIWIAPETAKGINLNWVLKRLGSQNVLGLLVEGGGEVNASFLLKGLAHRIAFFYAPMVIGGRDSRKGVAGDGITALPKALRLNDADWKRVGVDLFLTGLISTESPAGVAWAGKKHHD